MFELIVFSLFVFSLWLFRDSLNMKRAIALCGLMLLPLYAFAQGESAPVDPDKMPQIIGDIIVWLSGLGDIGGIKVGYYVVLAIKWIGLVAGIFSAISLAVSGVMMTLSGVLSLPVWVSEKIFVGAPAWAKKLGEWSLKIKSINDKAQKYLKIFSIGNSPLAVKK